MHRIAGRIHCSSMAFLAAAAIRCVAAQAQGIVHIDLPAQSLAQSLKAIGTATNTDVGFSSSQVAGIVAPSLEADVTVDGALIRVLTGTGLRPQHLDDHTIVIVVGESSTSNSTEMKIVPATAYALLGEPEDARQMPEASAQISSVENPSSPRSQELEEVVVTGTHIAGSPPIGSSLVTISAADIANSGYSTIGDVIRSIPQSFGGGVNPGVVGANGTLNQQAVSSASTVNLRGLGSDSTLTLIDGHRVAYDGYTNAVDISVIPVAAIERVEILTDSASAIYGSDAVAGVANFILKKNYEGVQTTVRVGGTSDGGATERQISQLFGLNWSGGNAFLNYEHYGQNELAAADRSFSADAGPQTLLPAQKRDSVFFRARQSLWDGVSTYVEGLYADRNAKTLTNYAGVNYGSSTVFPGETPTKLFYVASGLAAKLNKDWSASVDGTLSRGKNQIISSTLQGGVSTPSPDGFYGNRTASIEARAAGPMLQLPSGAVETAIGAGYQSEAYYDDTDPVSAKRHITYEFGELQIPVVKPEPERVGLERFELSVAARHQNYSDFGTSTTPKVGFAYVPTGDLSIRGSWGKAFRAPDLSSTSGMRQLYVAPAFALGSAAPPDAQAVYRYGANPLLKPETARSWSAGLDFTPAWAAPLRLSLTYFNIDYRNLITQPVSNLVEALSNPIYTPFVSPNPSVATLAALLAQANYFMDFTGGLYNPTKVIALIADQYQNISEESIHGFDLTGDYRIKSAIGGFDIFINGAWLTVAQQFIPNSSSVTLSGTVFNPPKLRARLGLTWQHEAWSAASFANYVGRETDNANAPPVGVSSWTTFDAQVTYSAKGWGRPFQGMHVTVAAQNLLNRKPPALSGASTYIPSLAYDSTNASPLGRFLSLTLTEDW